MGGLKGAFQDLEKLNENSSKGRETNPIDNTYSAKGSDRNTLNDHRTTAGKGGILPKKGLITTPIKKCKYEELRKRIKASSSKSDQNLINKYRPKSDINPDSSKKLDIRQDTIFLIFIVQPTTTQRLVKPH